VVPAVLACTLEVVAGIVRGAVTGSSSTFASGPATRLEVSYPAAR
jgi:hypothetical protein